MSPYPFVLYDPSDIPLEKCWFALPQLYFTFRLRPKKGRSPTGCCTYCEDNIPVQFARTTYCEDNILTTYVLVLRGQHMSSYCEDNIPVARTTSQFSVLQHLRSAGPARFWSCGNSSRCEVALSLANANSFCRPRLK